MNDIDRFVDFCEEVGSFSYRSELKNEMHKRGKAALKDIAAGLDLEPDTYEIRSNKAGIAVSGELTLHHEEFYLEINPGTVMRGHEVLLRSCKGLDDYTGGRNTFMPLEALKDWNYLKTSIELVIESAYSL